MVARLGIFIAVLSAVPLSYWLYAAAIVITGIWLWRERSKDRPPSPALRWATAAIWIGMVLLELPWQLSPRLQSMGNPPLLIIGDSVTAGMGSGAKHVWPELLPEHVEVHNLAQPGATTAMALKIRRTGCHHPAASCSWKSAATISWVRHRPGNSSATWTRCSRACAARQEPRPPLPPPPFLDLSVAAIGGHV